MHLNRLAAALSLLALATTAATFAADPDLWTAPDADAKKTNPIPSDPAALAAGKDTYAKRCLTCHGETGAGDGPMAKMIGANPGDLSKPAMWQQSDGTLFYKITTGRKSMPPFEAAIPDDDRWKLVHYIRTLAPKPAATQPK